MDRSQATLKFLVIDNQLGGAGSIRQETQLSDYPTNAEVEAKLGRVSAETDTKVARLEGKMDLVLSKLDNIGDRLADVREGNRSTRANLWVIGTALAVLVTALAFGVPAIYANGLQLRDVVHSEVQDSLSKPAPAKP